MLSRHYLKTFFITEQGETRQLSFIDALSYLKCEPDEKKISVGKNYFAHYDANNDAFDYSLVDEEIIAKPKVSAAGNDQKMIRYLKALLSIKSFTDDQEEAIRKMIGAWENGDIPAADTKAILKEIKNVDDGVEAFYKISSMVDDKYFEGRKRVESKVDGEKQVILACYMKGVEA